MSKNYNQTLQSNNTDLQAILDAIHELPEAGSGGTTTDNFIEEDAVASYTNNSATRIGSFKFFYNYLIEEINLPSCVSVGKYAFCGCDSLHSVNLPLCEELGECAFEACVSLQAISLPSCKIIQNGAFMDCNYLYSLTIGGTEVAQLMGIEAFAATPFQLGDVGYDNGARIYVPKNLVNAYKTATNWSVYAKFIVGA